MALRPQAVKRLVALYGLVEERHSLELQRTTAAVIEAEQAIAAQQHIALSARFSGRDALVAGDSMGRIESEIRRESTAWKQRRLEQARMERQELNDAARKIYEASRLKCEQMRQLAENITAQALIEQGRQLQAESDDQFLARRRWSDTRSSIELKG